MILYPAIDLKDGQCVRVVHGDFATATVFNENPADQAEAATLEAELLAHCRQNLAKLSDPALDAILEHARETTNPAQLAKLYAQAQLRLTDVDYPGLPVYQNSVLWAFSKKLRDVYVNTSHGTPFLTYAFLAK